MKRKRFYLQGDTPLVIIAKDNKYEKSFINALKYIVTKKIETMYSGHGEAT